MARDTTGRDPSLYLELDRKQWRNLRESMPMVLNENELDQLVGMGENVDLQEVTRSVSGVAEPLYAVAMVEGYRQRRRRVLLSCRP